MLCDPNRDLFAEWDIKSEVHLFFVLRWHELFDEHTFDSWQVRSSNVRTMLDELLYGLKVAQEQPETFKGLSALLDEIKEVGGNDVVIKEEFPFF